MANRGEAKWTFVTHKNSRKPWGKKSQRNAKQRSALTEFPVIKGVLADNGGYPSLCKRTKNGDMVGDQDATFTKQKVVV